MRLSVKPIKQESGFVIVAYFCFVLLILVVIGASYYATTIAEIKNCTKAKEIHPGI